MKIIVNGVYATGKTRFGNWLRDHQGFDHVDLEAVDELLWDEIPAKVAASANPTIVTWGVPIDEGKFDRIRSYRDVGIVPWWFEAEKLSLARDQYVIRSGEAEAKRHFDEQMGRLGDVKTILDELYGARRITVLTGAGFVSSEGILGILSAGNDERRRDGPARK